MFPDSFARGIAESFVNDIKDTCEQIEIVGSLRRQKYAVNDIDIIVIPKFIQEDDETLFGEPVQTNLLDRRLSQFCFKGTLSLEANGPKIKRFIKVGRWRRCSDRYLHRKQEIHGGHSCSSEPEARTTTSCLLKELLKCICSSKQMEPDCSLQEDRSFLSRAKSTFSNI